MTIDKEIANTKIGYRSSVKNKDILNDERLGDFDPDLNSLSVDLFLNVYAGFTYGFCELLNLERVEDAAEAVADTEPASEPASEPSGIADKRPRSPPNCFPLGTVVLGRRNSGDARAECPADLRSL
jgi:hypothetical protein